MDRSVKKCTFALFFGNRGFFPGSLMAGARSEMKAALEKLGHSVLMLDEKLTRFGGVETPAEGKIFADFLKKHAGEFQGVILCLPNFGDENGAVAALQDCGVPILVQAYPDELDKMAPELRRDAFCGKFSIMDVFCQNAMKFTALKPHTVHPKSPAFVQNIDHFDRMCRVVAGMKRMTLGAIGARTTAFKTVRIDELALQRAGITMETLDLTGVFHRMGKLDAKAKAVKEKKAALQAYTRWDGVPDAAVDKLTKLGVVLDQLVEELRLDTVALRCWVEMQEQLGISPCVLISEMNNRGITTACEVDVGNAVVMYVLRLASADVATCLDWNNNYGDDPDKCILFHCGPVPQKMMTAKGQVTDHAILRNAVGPGCAWGCNVGRISPTPFTFSSMLTENGRLSFYVGEGAFTKDPIPKEFFGCAGVAKIDKLQDVLQTIGLRGHRHHVSVTPSTVAAPVVEAFERYLGYDVMKV
jgi:L-fucose isomerase-like protein